jgi:hypothetical protein
MFYFKCTFPKPTGLLYYKKLNRETFVLRLLLIYVLKFVCICVFAWRVDFPYKVLACNPAHVATYLHVSILYGV